ncbi:protocadherin-8 [Electrophorus electricus]|uniref:protocadherin-8 n=1 Tax=Electrophorus electricus TaxID=8005 RepID=UPI0015D06317|nr:protocadherin-8 [Electrophorus electricus]
MEVRKMLVSLISVVIFATTVVLGITTKYYTYEEDAPGTFIGNLSMDLKIDPSEDPNTSFRFMQEGNSSLIQMRKCDGLLTVGQRIDREKLCQRSTQCLITSDVVVFSKEKFHLIHVEIHVRDINDHSPMFPHNEIQLEILESMAVGTHFPLEVANDLDVGNNYIQSYQLFHNSYFDIEVRTAEDDMKFAQLVLVKELDREIEDSYTLQVTASDGGSPPKSGSVTVHVKVLDSNDNSPQFEHKSLKVELNEDAPIGFLLLRVQAFDPDHGQNGDVHYDFVEGVLNDMKNNFDIDPLSGAVTVKSMVDFEVRKSYELNIQAYDLGENSIPSTCAVIIEIVDVNDNAPDITIKPMTLMNEGMAYITEVAAVESFVALISVTDKDSGANGYVHVSLHGHEHFKLQQAYGDNFMIVTTSALDREKIPEYNLTVIAEDLGSPPFKTFTQYTIRVGDENDNPPLFSQPVYEISVMENKAPGSYIASLVARDPDEAANGKVTYKLLENEVEGVLVSSFLSVDSVSGTLYTVSSLDHEHVKQIEVAILATDGGSPSLSSTALVKVRIVDENDNVPFITYPVLINGSTDVPIPYNAPAGYIALRVEAHDMDDGVNAELSYTILEDKEILFSINKKSGEIVLKHRLMFRYDDVIEIKVRVSDLGRTPFSCTATIRFVVSDTEPLEKQVMVVLESSDEKDDHDVDVSLIVIVLLGTMCVMLLVAIAAVALSRRTIHRDVSISKMEGGSAGHFKKTLLPSHSIDSSDTNSFSGGSTTVTEQISSSRGDSSYEEEQSKDSDNKVFQPLFNKTHFEPLAIWQGDRYALQTSVFKTTDQMSVKDSGKGDSDFNDSDSDTGGEAGQKMTTLNHRHARSSFHTGPMSGTCSAREIPTHASSTHVGKSGYTLAYQMPVCSQRLSSHVQGPSWRDYGYNTVLPRASEQTQESRCHRMGMLPSQLYYNQPAHAQMDRQGPATKEPTSDMATTPVVSF